MVNPFDDDTLMFLVLANDSNQHSLWPSRHPVPAGWRIVHDEDSRENSLAWIEANWHDLRPAGAAK